MKNPKEYLKLLFEEPFQLEGKNSIEYDFYEMIKQVQKDAYNQAIRDVQKEYESDYVPFNIEIILNLLKDENNLISPITEKAKCSLGKRVMFRMPKSPLDDDYGWIRYCNDFNKE